MAVNLSPVGGVAGQFFDNNGDPLVGGKLYTYAAGTTTPQTTYTNSLGTTANSNPIILNAGGRVPSEIWLTDSASYKFVLYSSTDQLIGSWDDISGINSNFVNFTSSQEIQTATSGQTVFTLTTMTYQPGTNSLTVYVDGVNQYGPGALYAYTETDDTTVTFNTGLHVGAEVKFTTIQQATSSATDAAQVAYQPAGTGAVTTNVQAKLRETVSVKDFGAVGDGVTDDTAAIQAAIDYCATRSNALYLPAGTYLISSTLTLKGNNFKLYGETGGDIVESSGRTTIKAAASFSGSIMLTFDVQGAAARYGIHLESFVLDGSLVVTTGFDTGWQSLPNGYVNDVTVQNCVNGFILRYASPDSGVTIGSGCWGWRFNNAHARVSGIGFDLYGNDHNTIFYGCVTRAPRDVTPFCGFRVGTNTVCSNVSFIGCDFEHNSTQTTGGSKSASFSQLYVKRGRAVSVVNSYVETVETVGSVPNAFIIGEAGVDDAVEGFSVENTHFRLTNTSKAIIVNSCSSGNIVGNDFLGSVDFDIIVNDVARVKKLYVGSNQWSRDAVTETPTSALPINTGAIEFTPTVSFSTNGDFSPTYSFQKGRVDYSYGRINRVYIDISVKFDTNAYTTSAGTFRIGNLPFTIKNNADMDFIPLSVFSEKVDFDTAGTKYMAAGRINTNYINLVRIVSSATYLNFGTSQIPASTSGFVIRITGVLEIE